MPNVFDIKEASAFSNEVKQVKVKYDFDKDGGAIAVFDMLTVDKDIVIHRAYTKVLTAVTSAGAPTLDIGIKGGDTNAIMVAQLKGALTLNAIIAGDSAADLLRVAAGAIISAEIKVATYTAGKLELVIEYSKF